MKKLNENFGLLNKNDKIFIQELIKDPDIEDLNPIIKNYAYDCFDLREVEETNFDAWKQQLYDYAASVDVIKEKKS